MNSLDRMERPGAGATGESLSPSPGFVDPRTGRDFIPEFYPLADAGRAPLPSAQERNDRIRSEFCAVYYHLNRLHAQLTDLRARAASSVDNDQERPLLQEIEIHLRHRDSLENRYAPWGVIAEPVARDGRTVNIRFTFGDQNVLRRQRTQLVSSTALLLLSETDDSCSGTDESCKS